jgi:hypothetical protein
MAEIRHVARKAMTDTGPTGAGLLYDARRGVYYAKPPSAGGCTRSVSGIHTSVAEATASPEASRQAVAPIRRRPTRMR